MVITASPTPITACTPATPLVSSPLADYTVPRLGSAAWSTALAGAIGTALVFLLALGVTWLLVIRRRRRGRPAPRSDQG